MKKKTFTCGPCTGLFTLKDESLPESGNQCLYLCRNPQSVLKNRLVLAKDSLPLSHWCLARQRHTDTIFRVTKQDLGRGAFDNESALQNCDALYTTESSVLIGVFTADCLGILLADPSLPLAAAVHSGWKGTAQAILYKMLARLRKENLLSPHSLHVYFSPSLMKSSLEVGKEVVDAIRTMAENFDLEIEDCIEAKSNGRFLLDNQGINLQMCRAFGIPEENLHPSQLDTLTNPRDCFSYRRTKPLDGEHFSCIWIEEPDSHPESPESNED